MAIDSCLWKSYATLARSATAIGRSHLAVFEMQAILIATANRIRTSRESLNGRPTDQQRRFELGDYDAAVAFISEACVRNAGTALKLPALFSSTAMMRAA